MLIMPKQNVFRVAASGDADYANKIPSAVQAALGITLQNSSSGLVAYGPEENAGNVTFQAEAVGSSPDVVSFSYTRNTGPVDIPMGLALTLCRDGFASIGQAPVTGSPQTGEIAEVWKAGSISGEVDIGFNKIQGLSSTPLPVAVSSSAQLPDEAWIFDHNT